MVKRVPGVGFYGKVRIATIGHRTAIEQAKGLAKKVGGKLTIGLSGTSEPLTPATKKSLAQKMFNHPVKSGDEDTKTLSSFLTHMNQHHDHLHLVAGSDRVEEYKSFLTKYNGKKDKKGRVPFNFKSWQVHTAGGEREDSSKDPTKMSYEEKVRSVSASKLEGLAKEGKWDHFKAYHPDIPDKHVRQVYNQIRKHHGLNEAAIGLTFARSEMPQIGASRSFVQYLKKNGVESVRTKVNPDNLKSSQMEFDNDKIEGLRQSPSKNPIIISNDGHVLDGHHRWLADQMEGRDCDAYVCNMSILDLMHKAKHYCATELNEEVSRTELAPMLDSFVSFASDKLGIKTIPKVRYKTDADDYNSFAAYNPSENELSVHTKNRHPMDVFRSVAHELVHHKQNEDGRIGKDIAKEGETGSDIENEANAEAGKIMRWWAKDNPDYFSKEHINEENLQEGINDPGKLKAIFLAGGPGSGKDYILNSVLKGDGLREINSDFAFEYLMKKNNLDMEMPDSERVEREIARGRAGNITKEMQRNALIGRQGVIINGTASNVEETKLLKGVLERLGYETMMVFVNTSNEVSRQRNVQRGRDGGRKVPDGTDKQGNPDDSKDIRQQKWDAAQKNIGEFQKIFGQDRFAVIDNSVDLRKASGDEKEQVLASHNNIRRMVQQFVRAENKNPRASNWIEFEKNRRGISDYTAPKTAKPISQIRKDAQNTPTDKPSNDIMSQARRLGLSYFGFGRFGRKIAGKNHVLYREKDGKLMRVQLNEDLRKWFAQKWVRFDTKGNIKGDCAREEGEGKPKCRPLAAARAMSKEDRAKSARRKRREDPVADRQGKGNKPVMVKTESYILNEKNQPTNPELWARAKSLAKQKFDVYPSAYANGWASKWYKSKGGGWKSVNEGREGLEMPKEYKKTNFMKKKIKKPLIKQIDEDFNEFFAEEGGAGEWGTNKLRKNYEKNTPGSTKKMKKVVAQENNGTVTPLSVLPVADGVGPELNIWRTPGLIGGLGNMSESIRGWALSEKTQARFVDRYGDLAEEKLYEAAARLEEAGCGCEHSADKKSIKRVRELSEASPAWTRKEGQNPEGGLNKKGVASYRAANPGSKLQTAVTTDPSKLKKGSKKAKRRLSFCRRMKGMKRKLTSAKTARDPDSRINKSLRKWNCE